MVSNLMVVLCSDKDASPVLNVGTLNHSDQRATQGETGGKHNRGLFRRRKRWTRLMAGITTVKMRTLNRIPLYSLMGMAFIHFIDNHYRYLVGAE